MDTGETVETRNGRVDYSAILPRGIATKILKELASDVSLRTVQRVLTGHSEDTYGILPIAARMAKEQQEAESALAKISQLKSK